MCTKTSKQNYPYSGLTYFVSCEKEEYKDGLCKKHYYRAKEKQLPWGSRVGYSQVTERSFFASGGSFKLKTDTGNILYRLRNNVIQRFHKKSQSWVATDIPVDISLFCMKYT